MIGYQRKRSTTAIALIVTAGMIPLVALTILLYDYAPYLVWVVVGIALLVAIGVTIWVTRIIIRRNAHDKAVALTIEQVEKKNTRPHLQDILKTTKSDRKREKIRKEIESQIHDSSTSEICSITKTSFSDTDIAIKCPHCSSKFKQRYLIEWLMTSERCPVCRVKIVID